MALPFDAVFDLGGKLIDRLWPDPAQANQAKLKLFELQQSGELAQMTGQLDVNKVEAASSSIFVAGWRPFIGWICGAAMAFKYIGGPLLMMIGQVFGLHITLSNIDSGDLMPILLGMLGLGVMRTTEKVKGVA
jgi:hypothetical protein